jgi:hypothetical protein
MKKTLLLSMAIMIFFKGIDWADMFGTEDNQFTINFVTISGNASSLNGTNISMYPPGQTGYRAFTDPSHSYRIGVYEITNDQWTKFQAEYGTVTGNPLGAYEYSPYWTGSNMPTNNVSWYEAAQFVNWLNVSTGNQVAYKFTGIQR